jgi:hypothetical protein
MSFPFQVESHLKKNDKGEAIFYKNGILKGNTIGLSGGRLWAELGGFTRRENTRVTVLNTRTGFGVTVAGDYVMERLNLYVQPGEICPEQFVAIDIAPGEEFSWSNTYTLSAPPGGSPSGDAVH